MPLQRPVGRNGDNLPDDVRAVQQLLLSQGPELGPVQTIRVSGNCDAQTIYLIEVFQRRVMHMAVPTGLVAPNSPTWHALNGSSGPASSVNPILDEAIRAMEAEFVSFAARFIQDSRVRANYVSQARALSAEILEKVAKNQISAAEGAAEANAMRNGLLDAGRLNSSDIGRALAESEKAAGLTLSQLVERYSQRLYQRSFAQLSAAEQDLVFVEVVKAAGRPNPRFTGLARNLGKAGKGLLVVSLALAVYTIVTSERPGRELAKQGVVLGVGFGGSVAAGAAAGLVCGPGAPVCVAVGAFAGGLVFALGADLAFDWLWE